MTEGTRSGASRAVIVSLALLVVGASVVYFVRSRTAAARLAGRHTVAASVPVTVTDARLSVVRQSLSIVGVARAYRQAAVSPKVPGRVLSIAVRDGQRVRAGQPVARMDIGDMRALVSAAAAGVRAAEAVSRKAVDGRRGRQVEMDGLVSQAVGGLSLARARLKQAELSVTLTGASAGSDRDRAAAGVRAAAANVRMAEVGLAQADDAVRRLEALYTHGGIAKVDLVAARSQADLARGQLAAARAGLDEANAAAGPAADTAPLRVKVSEEDVRAARAGVLAAEEGLAAARAGRVAALRVADRDVEAARAQVQQARSGVVQAESQVGSSILTSPLDGVVTALTARPGEFAQPGLAMLVVIDPSSTYLEVPLPLRSVADVLPGHAVRISLDGEEDRPVRGTVFEVQPVASTDNRTVPARVRLLEGPRLAPGAMARAEIELPRAPGALSVPADCVRNDSASAYVYVVQDGKAVRRTVTAGSSDGSAVEILAGLRAGETVIVMGPSTLRAGMLVTPVRQ